MSDKRVVCLPLTLAARCRVGMKRYEPFWHSGTLVETAFCYWKAFGLRMRWDTQQRGLVIDTYPPR